MDEIKDALHWLVAPLAAFFTAAWTWQRKRQLELQKQMVKFETHHAVQTVEISAIKEDIKNISEKLDRLIDYFVIRTTKHETIRK